MRSIIALHTALSIQSARATAPKREVVTDRAMEAWYHSLIA